MLDRIELLWYIQCVIEQSATNSAPIEADFVTFPNIWIVANSVYYRKVTKSIDKFNGTENNSVKVR